RLQGGALADAVAPQQPDHLAARDLERDAVQDMALAVIGVDVLDPEQRGHRSARAQRFDAHGITALRPSRRPLRGLLRMTGFLNAIIDLRHPEEARSAVSKDALSGCTRLMSSGKPRAPAGSAGFPPGSPPPGSRRNPRR